MLLAQAYLIPIYKANNLCKNQFLKGAIMLTGGHLNRQNKTKTMTKRKQFTATPQTKEEYELFSYRDVAIYSAALLAAGVGLYVARKRGSTGISQRTVAAPPQAPQESGAIDLEYARTGEKLVNDLGRLNRILVGMSQVEPSLQDRLLALNQHFHNEIPPRIQSLLNSSETDDGDIVAYVRSNMLSIRA